jgi:competence/damage-inducible protein CinA-like protein
MPNLEIITIGTELLLGEINDTNSTYIARTLRDHGIDIFRITTIGDNTSRIAGAIREALERADIVITTGGLGPTVDDPTRQAVAYATERELVFQPELWAEIDNRFKDYGRIPTENNRRQAFIPTGAIPVKNPVGTAPSFIVEVGEACVISLPGVPREMEFLLHESIIPFLSRKFKLNTQIIKATVLHAASIGESAIDEIIADLEKMSNPTVGLLAHPGQVDIRVTSKAESELEALQLNRPVIQEIKLRLGDHIYGQDEETLEFVISKILNRYQLRLGLVEVGLKGKLTERLKTAQSGNICSHISDEFIKDFSEFEKKVKEIQQNNLCNVWFGVSIDPEVNNLVHFYFKNSNHKANKTRKYGGPLEYVSLWAQNIGLDFLRTEINKSIKNVEMGEK